MKRKTLEDMGLTKEQVETILDENSQDIGRAKGDADKVQGKLTTAESEIATLKDQVAERDGQLETLKKSTGDVEGMKAQIETLQAENKTKDETHAAELKQLKVDSAVDAAIASVKGLNAKAIKALLNDLDKAELGDDGTVKGLAAQLEALAKAEDSKMLFETQTAKTKVKGAKPGESGNEDGDKRVDTSKMTYSELAAYMAANPDTKLNE